MANTLEASYDEQLYQGNSFSQSHPDRLASIAQLFGLTPPDIKHCRVLELGCAIGSNLIPMAEQLPDAHFVGVDISERQIALALSTTKELGLNNIEFRQLSILDVDADFGEFDYIIAHGLFSWVPTDVQEKIFSIFQNNLTTHGIAYISYNTYPGWHMKDMARNMMQFHVEQIEDSSRKVSEARSFINSLAELVSNDDSAYAHALKDENRFIQDAADWYIAHDHLEINNHPIYFHDFIKRANIHDLHYLCDAIFASTQMRNTEQGVQRFLTDKSSDDIRKEQYLDFINNRSFRQSLLTKTPLHQRSIHQGNITKLYIAASAAPQTSTTSFSSNEDIQFRFPRGETITTANPVLKTTLSLLHQTWPQAIAFTEIVNHLSDSFASPRNAPDNDQIARQLIKLFHDAYLAGLIELRTTAVPCCNVPGEQPMASKLAQYQSLKSGNVTNLRHEPVTLSEMDCQLLRLLDGKHTQQELLATIFHASINGTLTFEQDGKLITDEAQLENLSREHLETSLGRFAKLALLVA